MSSATLNLGDKVKVEKPKTKDPEILIELTRDIDFDDRQDPIHYVWGSIHYMDSNSSDNHVRIGTDSSGSTPIIGKKASLTFTIDDNYWKANVGKNITYYILLTFHNRTKINGKAYSGTFQPNQGNHFQDSGPVPSEI